MSSFSTPNLNETEKDSFAIKGFQTKSLAAFSFISFQITNSQYRCTSFTSGAKICWQWTENTGHLH